MHIGGVYVAMIDRDIAEQTDGGYLICIEDTDQSRAVEEAFEQFDCAFSYFHITDNRNDIAILKNSDQSLRLPMYH